MSSLLGRSEEPWPLSRAVDALTAAAARGGVPGLVWVAGIVYPSLSVNVELAQGLIGTIERVISVDLPGGDEGLGSLLRTLGPGFGSISGDSLGVVLFAALLYFPLVAAYRLVAGLARLSDPWLWDEGAKKGSGLAFVVVSVGKGERIRTERTRGTVALRDVWRAGEGLGKSALGMGLVLLALLCAATVVLLGGPVILARLLGLGSVMPLVAACLLPALLILLGYAVVLQVVNQLALHSLAHNRRGIASALTHAWRLVQSAPASVARAAVLELVLYVAVFALAHVPRAIFGHSTVLGALVLCCLLGFAGVTRAGFWARAYRDLGGLSAADAVPGLS